MKKSAKYDQPGAIESDNNTQPLKPCLKGDWTNISLLMLLYTLQGVPLGFSTTIPVILQNQKNVSYQDQAIFSAAGWPFSMKLLWAPLVDSLYVTKIGRRKSWLLPVQYLLGTFFLYTAVHFDSWIGTEGKPQVAIITFVFFCTNFLAATQDIAVDGWALTMLRKENVGYASMCNTSGQAIGMFLGYVFPILLDSESFCNNYLRSVPANGGMVSMQSFFYFWGVAFMLITSLVGLIKKENKDRSADCTEDKLNVFKTYSVLWDIVKMHGIRILIFALITYRIAFATVDNVTNLKLIDAGVSRDNLVIVQTALYPVKMLIPIIVSKYTSGPKPMSTLLNIFPFRLLCGISSGLLVYYTPLFVEKGNIDAKVPFEYFVLFGLTLFFHELLVYCMFVALLAFFSRISDPRFGGTYMTLLNTVANLGISWTNTISLISIDWLTVKKCSTNSNNDCSTQVLGMECSSIGGSCSTTINGYYLEIIICTIIGIIWYVCFNKPLRNLQTKSNEHWLVNFNTSVPEKNEQLRSLT
ncbi:acetyl-coenzyme A transporter 1-like [Adelges cooleyi]|uniref:acetyl-coenzyme A transporter 1-like n=1 Tax=Adelges cooleyi TaxID=133065 RepID=UPI00217F45C3|nr:acetyl-coenzyme A transporter 1-like [Adelges cooleyi]